MEGYCASTSDSVKLKLSMQDIQRFNSGAFPQFDRVSRNPCHYSRPSGLDVHNEIEDMCVRTPGRKRLRFRSSKPFLLSMQINVASRLNTISLLLLLGDRSGTTNGAWSTRSSNHQLYSGRGLRLRFDSLSACNATTRRQPQHTPCRLSPSAELTTPPGPRSLAEQTDLASIKALRRCRETKAWWRSAST